MNKIITYLCAAFICANTYSQVKVGVDVSGSGNNFVAAEYYTKANLSTDGSAVVNYGNLSNKPYVDVTDYGAKGDGITDDRTAIYNAAVAARDANKPLRFTTGTYKMNSNILLYGFNSNKNFHWFGEGDVTIDGSDIPELAGTVFFWFKSDTMQRVSILHNINEGDTVLYVNTSSLSWERGDILEMVSSEKWTYAQDIAPKGEFIKVKSILSDTSISVYDGFRDTYNYLLTQARLIDMAEFTWDNINIKGHNVTDKTELIEGMRVFYFRDISIKNSKIQHLNSLSLTVQYCYGGVIENLSTIDNILPGGGYGIVVGSSNGITIQNNRCQGERHAITIGGTWPARNIVVANNYLSNELDYNAVIDSHAASEDITIVNNQIIGGGISLRTRNAKVINNTLLVDHKNASGGGISFHMFTYPKPCDYYIATGNSINSLYHNDSAYYYGVAVVSKNKNDTVKNVIIANNTIQGGHTGLRFYTTVNSDTVTPYIGNIDIHGNLISQKYTGASGMYFENRIRMGTLNIHDNIMTSINGQGINFNSDTSLLKKEIYIRNNIIKCIYRGINLRYSNIGKATIEGNDIDCTAANSNSYGIYADSIDYLFVNNNKIFNSGNSGIYSTTKTQSVFWDNNLFFDCTGYTYNNNLAQSIKFTNHAWTTLNRPTNAAAGSSGYNTTTNKIEYWNGSEWLSP